MIQVEADAGEEWDCRIGWADLAQAAVGSAVRHSDFPELAGSGLVVEVSVKFTGDSEVRSLNASYRSKDKTTNVLSFPMLEPDMLGSLSGSGEGEILLGDIILAHGTCAAEAAEKDVPIEVHASHLIVHGTLHLLGYDHEDGAAEAEAMEDVERAALAAIGISDPYAVTEVQT
ncbi:MAG TPA: rRNA maturation RNase YbeY [Allosphingosinicella sp.]|nr:rRNA maturation RNase YbeY [Allosphingosinicella sp.]